MFRKSTRYLILATLPLGIAALGGCSSLSSALNTANSIMTGAQSAARTAEQLSTTAGQLQHTTGTLSNAPAEHSGSYTDRLRHEYDGEVERRIAAGETMMEQVRDTVEHVQQQYGDR